jgi:REP element-mobilizing transposase RayT
MPRRPRIELPGFAYHVTQHGIDKLPIFRDERDRGLFLAFFHDEVERSGWTCLAYCLMQTHYHVLIELSTCTLSSGFQRLNGRYAQAFNHRHGRRGHLFERRFRDVIIESDAHRFEVQRYVHLNPVRANICAKPESYVWSDYAGTSGVSTRDPFVDPATALEPFGIDLAAARRRYRRFVAEADPRVRRGLTRVRPPVSA